MIVVLSHYSNTTKLLNGALGNGAGQFGVMLFFLLSGFLMSYLYMGDNFSKNEVYRYLVARVARVVPLFLLVVMCSYLLQKFGIVGILYDIPNKEVLFSHIALLSGTSVLWTIPAEIQFYVIFIFLWWFWSKRRGQLFILISLSMVVLVILDFPRNQGSLFGIPFDTVVIRSLPYFLMGLIFGQLYLKWEVPNLLTSRAFILSLMLIPLLYPVIFTYLTGRVHEEWRDVGVFFIVSLVFFIFTFLIPDGDKLTSNRIGDYLGKISYSLYLLHVPILWQISGQAIQNPWLFLPIFLVLTIIISQLSYSMIESPSRRLIRAIAPNRHQYSGSN